MDAPKLTVQDAAKLTAQRLRDELTKRGLPSDGLKPALVKRLQEAIQKEAEVAAPAPAPVPVAAPAPEPVAAPVAAAPSSSSASSSSSAAPAASAPAAPAPATEKKEAKVKPNPTGDGKRVISLAAVKAAAPGEEEIKKRAERFGTTTTAAAAALSKPLSAKPSKPQAQAKPATDEKSKAALRAKRFGGKVEEKEKEETVATKKQKGANAKAVVTDAAKVTPEEIDHQVKRAKKFGTPLPAHIEEALRRQQRAEKFAAGGAEKKTAPAAPAAPVAAPAAASSSAPASSAVPVIKA